MLAINISHITNTELTFDTLFNGIHNMYKILGRRVYGECIPYSDVSTSSMQHQTLIKYYYYFLGEHLWSLF